LVDGVAPNNINGSSPPFLFAVGSRLRDLARSVRRDAVELKAAPAYGFRPGRVGFREGVVEPERVGAHGKQLELVAATHLVVLCGRNINRAATELAQ
jgi:hypothetical protein